MFDIDPELRAECEAAGLLDPVDPDPPTMAELREAVDVAVLHLVAMFN